MSYPLSLDEYPESELIGELARRKEIRIVGLCDYCCRDSGMPTCKFPERHRPNPQRNQQ